MWKMLVRGLYGAWRPIRENAPMTVIDMVVVVNNEFRYGGTGGMAEIRG